VCVKRRTPFFKLTRANRSLCSYRVALCVLAMFNAIPNQDTSHPDPQFFVWFLVAGGLVYSYDVYLSSFDMERETTGVKKTATTR